MTGATGFIGRFCLPALLDRGFEVHALTSREPLETAGEVTWHRGDLLVAGEAERLLALARPTHLLHLAWYAVPGTYLGSLENLRWTQASLALFRAFQARGGQRVLAAGTCAEYEWGLGVCHEERTPRSPTTLYGACKKATGEVLLAFARAAGFAAAWARLFHLYGPGEDPRRLVGSVLSSLLAGQPARCSSGEQRRDFLHVEDASAALVALLDSNVCGAVNVASGVPVAVRDMVMTLARQVGRPDLVQLGTLPWNASEPSLLVADTHRLRHEVGWSPRFDLERGVSDVVSRWRMPVPASLT